MFRNVYDDTNGQPEGTYEEKNNIVPSEYVMRLSMEEYFKKANELMVILRLILAQGICFHLSLYFMYCGLVRLIKADGSDYHPAHGATATYYQSSVVTPYGMKALRNGAFFNYAIPENVRLENDYIGLKVFEVNESLNEIKFVAQNIEVSTKFDFVFDAPYLACWNQKMDISLSLLNVSVGINDIRLKFLLRLMAIETLASSPQYRDSEYMEAIDKINLHLDSLDICPEYKQMLKSQLGQFKEQSISQKVTHLLKQHLSEKLYADMTAQK